MRKMNLVAAATAALAFTPVAWADSLPAALAPPLPSSELTLPELPLTQAPVLVQSPAREVARMQARPAQVDVQADISAFGFPCDMHLTLTPLDGALLLARIDAPCRPFEQVRLDFGDLHFDQSLGMTGTLEVTVPALRKTVTADAIFDDFAVLTATAVALGADGYQRIALSWDQPDGPVLQIGGVGLKGSRLTRLGDGSGAVAQILSHKIDPMLDAGVLRLSLRRATTDRNCGAPLSGQVHRAAPGEPRIDYSLTLAARPCTEIGGEEVLKNVLQDLKLARN